MRNNFNSPPIKGWVWTRLGEVCETTSGGTPSRKNITYFGGSIPWLKSGELENKVIKSSEEFITEEGLRNSSTKVIPKGAILIALYGATVGKLGVLEIEAAINQAICAILPSFHLNHQFLFWYLDSYRKKLLNARKGGAQPNISQLIVNNVPLPLPPLAEQQRIVARIEELFTKLDAGVAALKKVKAQLKRYRQAVLKYAFAGKLTEEWRETHKNELEPAAVLLEQIKAERKKAAKGKYKEMPPLDTSDLPEIPDGWVWTRVGEIGIVNPKFNAQLTPNDMDVTFLPMKCVEELTGHINLSLLKKVSEVKKGYTSFINGDILFAKITPCMENGKVAIADGLRNGIGFGSTEFHVIRLNERISRKLIFYFLIRSELRKDAQRNMKGTAGQLRVPQNYIIELIVPLPSYSEQHQIVEEIERRFSIVDEVEKIMEQSLKQAERLRMSILKRAFEGKLVPQDPDDEPAEKLLERIKKEKRKNLKEVMLNGEKPTRMV
jgi:type I restriction enzyme S subunit